MKESIKIKTNDSSTEIINSSRTVDLIPNNEVGKNNNEDYYENKSENYSELSWSHFNLPL